jgi:hypothetical protein
LSTPALPLNESDEGGWDGIGAGWLSAIGAGVPKPGIWAAEDRTAMHINKTTRTGFVLIITFLEQYRVLDASEMLVGSFFESAGCLEGVLCAKERSIPPLKQLINQLVRLSGDRIGCKLLWANGEIKWREI